MPDNKREAQLIKELEEILSREGLSSNPSEKGWLGYRAYVCLCPWMLAVIFMLYVEIFILQNRAFGVEAAFFCYVLLSWLDIKQLEPLQASLFPVLLVMNHSLIFFPEKHGCNA